MSSLDGVRVLDLTQHLSGPYCTMMLGDCGAEVIKVEKPNGGDDQRRLGPFVEGVSSPFMMINRNKLGITLNLKSSRGVEVFLDLARQSDIVIENFRPGVADKLGVGYEQVRAVNPAAVYCSISGYGQTGPNRAKGGFDLLGQGMTGMLDLNTPPGGAPSKTPVSIHDIGAGVLGANAILAAYIHRLKHGAGQYVDISLVEAGLAFTVQEAAAYFVTGTVPQAHGTRNHLAAPYQAYRAGDGYVLVGGGHQKLWEDFCRQVVERPEWIDDVRFASVTARVESVDYLEQLVEEVLCTNDVQFWVDRLDAAGVPGGPMNTLADALRDPHMLSRDMVVEMNHAVAGPVKGIGIPAKMSETPGSVRLAAPTLGQDTEEILNRLLSIDADEVAALRAEGVL